MVGVLILLGATPSFAWIGHLNALLTRMWAEQLSILTHLESERWRLKRLSYGCRAERYLHEKEERRDDHKKEHECERCLRKDRNHFPQISG
jgi:hypothetical protein